MSCRSSTSKQEFILNAGTRHNNSKHVHWMETGFSSVVDLQQGLYPQHCCPLPMGKAMFLFCQVRIVQTATQIIMSFADLNTAQNHVEGKAK